MEAIKIPVVINGEPHTVIARYFETSEYGAMTELKTEGHLLCLDKDLQPFMGHLPDGWVTPVVDKLQEIFSKSRESDL